MVAVEFSTAGSKKKASAGSFRTREGGRVVNVAVVIATGVTTDGRREILGVATFTSEDEAAWLDFLRSLVERGLTGVELVISDAHTGPVAAIESAMFDASWQRCRTHFMTNLLSRVPKSTQGLVASLARSIFAQPDAATVWDQLAAIAKQLTKIFPEAARLLGNSSHDVLAFTAFPKAIWRQIWSNNPLERLNREIRRRTSVVGIFPNRDSVIRLIGAVLCEQNDKWCVGRRHMGLSTLAAIPQLNETLLSPSGKEVSLEPVAAQA